jgi:hypothetical protein
MGAARLPSYLGRVKLHQLVYFPSFSGKEFFCSRHSREQKAEVPPDAFLKQFPCRCGIPSLFLLTNKELTLFY